MKRGRRRCRFSTCKKAAWRGASIDETLGFVPFGTPLLGGSITARAAVATVLP
jgi:hypothetical protein